MINMNPAYRAEIRDLKRNRKQIFKDAKVEIRANEKEIATRTKSNSSIYKRLECAVTKIDNRIAILEGRLS